MAFISQHHTPAQQSISNIYLPLHSPSEPLKTTQPKMSPKTNVNVVLGCMTFGDPKWDGMRINDVQTGNEMFDLFAKHGHRELDSARMYGGGSSEELVGQLDWQKRGFQMETKLFPTAGKGMSAHTAEEWTHRPEDVRAGLMASLKALQTDKIEMFYLHGPDRATPFEETMREVDALHREGKFNRFGLSNFFAWEVAQICEIAEKNGWVKPSAYQGIYNAFHRGVEPELMPCLRHYGIALYSFQPLAGGFLTGKYSRETESFSDSPRFDPKGWVGRCIADGIGVMSRSKRWI